MSLIFRSLSGRLFVTAGRLGGGGEGTIYSVEGDSTIALKIYHPNLAEERKAKIEAMCSAHLSAGKSIVFPTEPLFDATGVFVGFRMPRVGGQKPVHEVYLPTSRKTNFPSATFPFLLRVAGNIARAMAFAHSADCIVGDINHSGVLVSSDATVTLIDANSFQISRNGKTYFCEVGVPEFTPPELQGVKLNTVIRTENHDGFGLAVVIFCLLFMGRHPFCGKFLGTGNPPDVAEAISNYRFAY